jgi:D-alanine-D-alanine ligase
MKVAVVHNTDKNGVINHFGQPCPEKYSPKHIELVIDSLRAGGHTVASVEGNKTLLAELEEFMPPCPTTGWPTGLVFNMAYGIQGECRYTHVPAMLEAAGVPYTGSGPLGHALALDKVVTKILIAAAGVPTPAFKVMSRAGQSDDGLTYPLVVKPKHESTSYGLQLVRHRDELDSAVASIVQQYQQDALVEDYIDGREVCIGLLGNNPVEILPPVELDFGDRPLRLMTWDDKYHKRMDEPTKVCPAPLDEPLAAQLRELAVATFHACHLKDYARVDIRIDPAGRPFVLEINSMASLGGGGSYMKAALTAGYTHETLVNRILDVAHQRYFNTPAPRDEAALADRSCASRVPAELARVG